MLKCNIPLRCRVVKRVLTIEIGISTLKHAAARHEEFWQPQTDKVALVVNNPDVFAKDVLSWLTEEAEDGSNPVSRLLDEAIKEAVNQGSEGVDYDAMEKIEEAEKQALALESDTDAQTKI
jgi:hypothetical protein